MSSYNYLKVIYNENPIEIAKTSYFKIIYKENPIEMKNSAYWFKCPVIFV